MNIFREFWCHIQTFRAPVAVPLAAVVPVAPMAQEQFPATEAAYAASRKQDERLKTLYQRVVKTNNAHITRDRGGAGVLVVTDDNVAPLTQTELVELSGRRAGVVFTVPKVLE